MTRVSGWQCENCERVHSNAELIWKCPSCQKEVCDSCFGKFAHCNQCCDKFTDAELIDIANTKGGYDFA